MQFKAIPVAADGPFPAGVPAWSGTAGASGSGETATATCSSLSASATDYKTVIALAANKITVDLIVFELTPNTTPQDNFAGRSQTRFGVGEVVDLSYTTQPAGVNINVLWSLNGPGTLAGSVFTAGDNEGAVTLQAEIANGPSKGQRREVSRNIVAPSAYMVKMIRTNIAHFQDMCSIGFLGEIYLTPKDVSFDNIQFRETDCPAAVAEGYFLDIAPKDANGNPDTSHHATRDPVTGEYAASEVGPGNADRGSQVAGRDEAAFWGGPPFRAGHLVWHIPWEYRVVGLPTWRPFATAIQDMAASANGRATISKHGVGPFSKEAGDNEVQYTPWNGVD